MLYEYCSLFVHVNSWVVVFPEQLQTDDAFSMWHTVKPRRFPRAAEGVWPAASLEVTRLSQWLTDERRSRNDWTLRVTLSQRGRTWRRGILWEVVEVFRRVAVKRVELVTRDGGEDGTLRITHTHTLYSQKTWSLYSFITDILMKSFFWTADTWHLPSRDLTNTLDLQTTRIHLYTHLSIPPSVT